MKREHWGDYLLTGEVAPRFWEEVEHRWRREWGIHLVLVSGDNSQQRLLCVMFLFSIPSLLNSGEIVLALSFIPCYLCDETISVSIRRWKHCTLGTPVAAFFFDYAAFHDLDVRINPVIFDPGSPHHDAIVTRAFRKGWMREGAYELPSPLTMAYS